MKIGVSVNLVLVTILTFFPSSAVSSESTLPFFTNFPKTYRIPIKPVGKDYAATDFGMAGVYSFAQNKQPNQWTYAYQVQKEIDSATSRLMDLNESGNDCFVRFFETNTAVVQIRWWPLKNDVSNSDVIKPVQRAINIPGAPQAIVAKIRDLPNSQIGGYPAIGVQHNIRIKDKTAYISFYAVQALKEKRQFLIAFYFDKGFEDPLGAFAKIREKIVFLADN